MVLSLLVHVTPSSFFKRILRSKAFFTNHIFFKTAVLRKLFDIRFSYNHCNFSRVCLLVKMASKTVTRSIELAFAVNGLELSCSLHAPRGHSCTSCPLILQAGPGPLKSPKTRKGDKNCFRPIIDDDHLFPNPTPSSPKK